MDDPLKPERRAEDPRLISIHHRIDGLETEVKSNTAITKRIDEATSGLVEMWVAAAGAFKVLGWLAKIARWFTIVAGALSAGVGVWYAFRHGGDIVAATPKVDIPGLIP